MMASGGVLAGTAIALGASRAVARMLFATSARDTATFVLVPAMLALVALLDPGAARGVDRSGGGAAGRVRGRA
ncbi:MAG: hypothetical protein LAP87_25650 [Acidobacteriia bacterium]|nr:hypothetical protein [Terriglobia bacterium]